MTDTDRLYVGDTTLTLTERERAAYLAGDYATAALYAEIIDARGVLDREVARAEALDVAADLLVEVRDNAEMSDRLADRLADRLDEVLATIREAL